MTEFVTDLIIVGGGPAGCAAAITATSLAMNSTLIESDRLCAKLFSISSISNVAGDVSTGPQLASKLVADMDRATRCRVLTSEIAQDIRADDERVVITLRSGDTWTAPYAVIATGTTPMTLTDVEWARGVAWAPTKPLWQATSDELADRDIAVLGADRPLGTLLRTMTDLRTKLHVIHPAADQYKTDEVRDDPRVTLIACRTVNLRKEHPSRCMRLTVDIDRHRQTELTVDDIFLNLGSRANVPHGDLRPDDTSYCPPGRQHPRLLIAGDLRSARYQRIMTAFGSGAEAALQAYYQITAVP